MKLQSIKKWFGICVQKTTFKTKLRLADQLAIVASEKRELEERVRFLQDQIEGKERILETMSVNSCPTQCLVHGANPAQSDANYIITDSKQFDFESEMEDSSLHSRAQ